MLLSLGVLPSFHSIKKHAPHKWIMLRNQSWNSLKITGMSDLAILFKETVNTDEQASHFVTNALSSLDVQEHPLRDWLLHCHHWSDRFHSNRFCCCRLRSRPTIWSSSRKEGQSSQRLSAMQTFFFNFKSWTPKTYSCSLSASEQPALFLTSTN